MVASSVVLYFYVRALLLEEVDEELYSTSSRIESSLKDAENLPSLPPLIEVKRTSDLLPDVIRDTLMFDPFQEEEEIFRELSVFKEINGQNYQITVRTIIIETEDFLSAIVVSYIVIIVVVFIFLFYFNRTRNKRIWRPFFNVLEQMRSFSLRSKDDIKKVDSEIEEFSELGLQVANLMNKVRNDYENLKQYTEDVSHEIQTPIAVLQAKIDNLFDDEQLTTENFEALTSIQQDVKRLSQLNRRLAVLTKIDNNQYQNVQAVELSGVIEDLISNFHELSPIPINFKKLNEKKIHIDPFLAELLCNNLLSNAIKYSPPDKGEIEVILENHALHVSNPGDSAYEEPEKLFVRFYRSDTTAIKSMGLGLAIVKKICDYYGYTPGYLYKDNRHVFTIRFHE